jgi:hypothetical protein
MEKKQLEVQLASEKTRLEESLKLEHDTSANLSSGKSVSEATSRLYGELLTANSNRQRGSWTWSAASKVWTKTM